ncbi:hypothetical protein THIARS_60416 [Thiomonas delicata]|uniref:Uncharacterized protein n=1 Tax=Thiomonas delicata TaxID=364030 RepID=A0A238D373_THIDL|nr:hypothetical protein THIARS_60416 [Thiomonas delicata]
MLLLCAQADVSPVHQRQISLRQTQTPGSRFPPAQPRPACAGINTFAGLAKIAAALTQGAADIAARACATVRKFAIQQLIQRRLIRRVPLRLPPNWSVGQQSTSSELPQNFRIGPSLATWRVDIFDTHQPAPSVDPGIEP